MRVNTSSMNLNYSKRDRNALGLGLALVALADLALAITAQGGGGLFVWNLITWPLAVLGGVIVGYAVANIVLTTDKRIPRTGFAIVGVLLAFTSQNVMRVISVQGADFIPVMQNVTPLGLAFGVVIISLIEIGLIFDEKIGF